MCSLGFQKYRPRYSEALVEQTTYKQVRIRFFFSIIFLLLFRLLFVFLCFFKSFENLFIFRLAQLLEVLNLCVKLFEYPGKKVQGPKGAAQPQQGKKVKPSDSKVRLQTLEEAILNRGAARDMLQRHKATTTTSMSFNYFHYSKFSKG